MQGFIQEVTYSSQPYEHIPSIEEKYIKPIQAQKISDNAGRRLQILRGNKTHSSPIPVIFFLQICFRALSETRAFNSGKFCSFYCTV